MQDECKADPQSKGFRDNEFEYWALLGESGFRVTPTREAKS